MLPAAWSWPTSCSFVLWLGNVSKEPEVVNQAVCGLFCWCFLSGSTMPGLLRAGKWNEWKDMFEIHAVFETCWSYFSSETSGRSNSEWPLGSWRRQSQNSIQSQKYGLAKPNRRLEGKPSVGACSPILLVHVRIAGLVQRGSSGKILLMPLPCKMLNPGGLPVCFSYVFSSSMSRFDMGVSKVFYLSWLDPHFWQPCLWF